MSNHFSAGSASILPTSEQSVMMDGESACSSSKMEIQATIDNRMQKGGPGIPSAEKEVSFMSSDHQQNIQNPANSSQKAFSGDKNVDNLFATLAEALALEPKYQPNLFLPLQSNDFDTITIGCRDGAANVLRCLKVWYELPSDVLFAAINLVDRFLSKMKVKPKHISCIAVGSFHLAIKQLALKRIDTDDLVIISQCHCTSRDLERMSDIIANKIGVQIGIHPVTGLTFIQLFYHIFRIAACELELGSFYDAAIHLTDLEMMMEQLAVDANCSSIRPSELALVMLFHVLDASVSKFNAGGHCQISSLVDYAIQLQKMCRIPDSTFFHTHATVVKILSNYNGQQKMPYKQILVWKLSSRTIRNLRPTDKLKDSQFLPTIKEDNHTTRFRASSTSSEDGSEDWPTSPIFAVCEQL